MNFSLKRLLLFVAIVAAALYIGPCTWKSLNGNFDEINAMLRAHPGISDVEIMDHEQVEGLIFDTLEIRFKIIGKPDSMILINTPGVDIFSSAESIPLDRIGDVCLVATHIDDSIGYSGTGGVDVGPGSDLREVLPFPVRNIDEIITRYDELLAGFKKWPTSSKPGVVELSPTERIEYYAEPIKTK